MLGWEIWGWNWRGLLTVGGIFVSPPDPFFIQYIQEFSIEQGVGGS